MSSSAPLSHARRPWLGLSTILLVYLFVSGFDGCQDTHYTGSKFAGTGNKTMSFSGRTDTKAALISVQMLRDQSRVPDNNAGNWTTLAVARGSSTGVTWNDPAPYYDWTTGSLSVAHGAAWPLGGVTRVRTMLATSGTPVMLASFDDDYSACAQAIGSASWLTIGATCLTRYPRPGVAYLVSTAENPTTLPNNSGYPTFLNRKYSAFHESNLGLEYYRRLRFDVPNATSTEEISNLGTFKSRYNLGGSGYPIAYYYNRGDLGLGREMHCTEYDHGSEAGVACYVTNYRGITRSTDRWGGSVPSLEQPAVNDAIARRNPLATVAMIYDRHSAEPVKFIVFNGRGSLRAEDSLREEQRLDDARLEYLTSYEGNQLPSNCAACHGGSVQVAADAPERVGNVIVPQPYGSGVLTNVFFLPFDLQAFRYSLSDSAYSRASQEEAFRKLNALVLKTNVPTRIRELVNGWYGGDVNVAGRKFDNSAVPPGWRNTQAVPFAENLYENVFEPYCQGCHISQSIYSFATAQSFVDAKAQILVSVCGNAAATGAPSYHHRMPHAEATLFNFWNSGARGHLLAALDARGACD